MQHSADRLTMDSPNISKMTWSTMKIQTLFPASGNSSKLSTLDTGNNAVKYPTKLMLPEPPETRPNRSLTLPSLTTSPERFFTFQAEEQQLGLYPGQGLHFRTEETHHSQPSSKLGKDGKLTPQERQHRLDNKLCLFCGTSRHVAKDCPKSTSASSKARVSKTDQGKSASTNSDSKKD